MRRALALAALAAVFLIAAYMMANYSLITGSGLPLYSSRRYDPFGTSAFRELLVRRGYKVDSLERPLPLTRGTNNVLVMILPVGVEMRGNRFERLMDWVESGNRILILSRYPPAEFYRLFAYQDTAVGEAAKRIGTRREKLQARGDYAKALDVRMNTTRFLAADLADGEELTLALAEPGEFLSRGTLRQDILAELNGSAVAALHHRGEGEVVWIADPTPATNSGLVERDNAAILLFLTRGEKVYFDEYSLGLGDEGTLMDWVKRAGLVPFVLQAVLALFLLARSGETDFGDMPAEPTDQGEATEKQIAILANLYEKTLGDKELAERKRQYNIGKN
jgi:hypothetical protein